MMIWALFLFCISGGRGLDYWVEDYIQGKLFYSVYPGVEDWITGLGRGLYTR